LNQKGIEVCADDLHLMDLGYYKLTHFAEIAQRGGYFISRYKVGTSLFSKNADGIYEPIEWSSIFDEIQGDSFDREVYLGASNDKLKVRLHLNKKCQ
jgi:hypothetical protein